MTVFNDADQKMPDKVQVRSYEIPIRIRALKTANIYVVDTGEKKILIDSGMGPEVDHFLKFSGEDAKTFDMIVLSHMHIDHVGGASHLRSKYGTPVAMGKGDVEVMNRIRGDPEGFERNYVAQLRENGMPESVLEKSFKQTPAVREIGYYTDFEVDQPLDSGTKIDESGRIKLIEVPGHSPGSITVYLPNEQIIFTGDHVLRDITPNISKYIGIRDSLGSYISSLEKLREVPVEKGLPGHGKHIDSFRGRIDSLVEHHRTRLDEILGIAGEWHSPYEVARKMRWSKGRSMDSMNSMETVFAIGEATSHLERLEEEGRIRSTLKDGVNLYRRSM